VFASATLSASTLATGTAAVTHGGLAAGMTAHGAADITPHGIAAAIMAARLAADTASGLVPAVLLSRRAAVVAVFTSCSAMLVSVGLLMHGAAGPLTRLLVPARLFAPG